MDKQTEMKAWKRILGLEEGDLVRIVRVFDHCLRMEPLVGKVGVIVSKIILYANRDKILYFSPRKGRKAYTAFRVKIGSEDYFLIDSDLEYFSGD